MCNDLVLADGQAAASVAVIFCSMPIRHKDKPNRKILAVASLGGHWKQLLRIASPLGADHDIVYVTTHPRAASMLPSHATMYVVSDFSRWDVWRLPAVLWRMWRIVGRERPGAILTTGAAPGLMAVIAGRLRGVRTIWVDSIANAAQLSASGRAASYLAHMTFTQWPHLAVEGRVYYHGNTFGIEEDGDIHTTHTSSTQAQ